MRWLPFLLFLSSCCRQELSVFTEYVSIESLPSFRIDTPDPRLYCPDYGQKLHIYWSVEKEHHACNLILHMNLRFVNGEDFEQWITLNTPSGIYIYPLLNDEYWNKEGILTYKIELYADNELIQEWRHQLWAERIQLKP